MCSTISLLISLVWTTGHNNPQGDPGTGPQKLDTIVTGKGMWYLTDHDIECNGQPVPKLTPLPFERFLQLCPEANVLSIGLNLGSGVTQEVEIHAEFVNVLLKRFETEQVMFNLVFQGIAAPSLRAEVRNILSEANKLSNVYAKDSVPYLHSAANTNVFWIDDDTAQNDPLAAGFEMIKYLTIAARYLVLANARDLVLRIALTVKVLSLHLVVC